MVKITFFIFCNARETGFPLRALCIIEFCSVTPSDESKVKRIPGLVLPSRNDWSVNQKVVGSIPGLGTCLGCGLGRWLGACERQPTDISLPF